MKNLLIPENFGIDPKWMVGVVEDRADPQQRGRCRVRWFGYYSPDIPTDNLPWSIPIQDITSAGIGGIGVSPTGIMEGTMVLGTWLDGNDMQNAAIIGVIGPIDGIVSSSQFDSNPNAHINSSGIMDNDIGANTPSNVRFVGNGPPWLQVAKGEIGTHEIKGGYLNPRVMQYTATVGLSRDNHPWCAAFVAWCLKNSGMSITGLTGMARSSLKASALESISEPLHGCIAVFSRGRSPTSGHVGFVDSIQGGKIRLLGGNQSDQVNVSGYSAARLLGYRWPRGYTKEGFGI